MIDFLFIVPNAPKAIIVSNNLQTLGVAQLASVCQENGYCVDIIDAYLDDLDTDEALTRVLSLAPVDTIGFYTPSETTLLYNIMLIQKIKEYSENITIVLGGPYASMASREILMQFTFIDLIIRGEAEEVIIDWMKVKEDKKAWQGVSNLSYIDELNFIETPYQKMKNSLDTLPFPNRELTMDSLKKSNGNISMVTSRGCYGSCSFCIVQSFWSLGKGSKWRGQSAQRVVSEIKHLIEEYDIQRISFQDDIFFGPGKLGVERAFEFCRLVKKENLNFKFSFFCRADNVKGNIELFRQLKEIGLTNVFIGIESGSEMTLEYYSKNVDRAINLEAIEILKTLNIEAFLGAVFFHPKSTLEDIEENVYFWRDVLANNHNVISSIYGTIDILEGTPLQKELSREGLLRGDTFRGYEYDFEDGSVTELLALWREFQDRYFFPAYISESKKAQSISPNKSYEVDHFFSRVQSPFFIEAINLIKEKSAFNLEDFHTVQMLKKYNREDINPMEVDRCKMISCL